MMDSSLARGSMCGLSLALLSSASQLHAAPKTKMTTPIPASITTPDSVQTRIGTLKFVDGYPDDATTQKVYDQLDFQRGVEAFLAAMPGASVYAIREGMKRRSVCSPPSVSRRASPSRPTRA